MNTWSFLPPLITVHSRCVPWLHACSFCVRVSPPYSEHSRAGVWRGPQPPVVCRKTNKTLLGNTIDAVCGERQAAGCAYRDMHIGRGGAGRGEMVLYTKCAAWSKLSRPRRISGPDARLPCWGNIGPPAVKTVLSGPDINARPGERAGDGRRHAARPIPTHPTARPPSASPTMHKHRLKTR
ncbi:hypothetical protein E2C01_031039 [Portunus trituberculatus]|uniref:Uncharacterized protein n=1 Tax=Portunus trituberculatus TaxID=210409 RepID=A0A5B7EXH7_PORTR|nr:hypothetical protein [Portunus trituberculatus]